MRLAREEFALGRDRLLFSLSFNSQDLPTKDSRPTQSSEINFCSDRYKTHIERCPQMQDYRPGDAYVDLVGVTLYNRGNSRADDRASRKTPQTLLQEDDLYQRLAARGKPLIIDELGTSGAWIQGTRSPEAMKSSLIDHPELKNMWLRERRQILLAYPEIV